MGRQYLAWIAPGETHRLADLAPGEGAVIRKGASFVAVHKDEQGKVKACSAVCTHLGGIVKWNSLEKSWDCPAHGSRFDGRGRVLNGPSAHDLPKLEDRQRFKDAHASELYDVRGKPLGVLTDNRNIVLVRQDQIAPAMQNPK